MLLLLLYSNDNNSSTDMKNVQLTIREELTSHQYNLIRSNKKLKFYSVFKIDCHKSAWLLEHNQHKSPQYRKLSKIFAFAPSIVFDLTFTETLGLDIPFLRILTTMKKPSSYLTMSILISADFHLLTCSHVWNIDKNLFFHIIAFVLISDL